MLGALIGDIVGSIYEFHPIKSKKFNIKDIRMRMTDDSILTLAVARCLMRHYPINYDEESVKELQKDLCEEFVRCWKKHPTCGFGAYFFDWCEKASVGEFKPYNSYGNGSAMRISPVGWIAKSEEEVRKLTKIVTEITHNHPEGIKGAEATAMAIYLALHGSTKEEIKERMINDYYPIIKDLDFEILCKTYTFSEICQKSVPQAIYCFLISTSLEDTIRNCVAIGGDCDTTGAIAGAIAEAYYNKDKVSKFESIYLDFFIAKEDENTIKEFHKMIGSKKFK